MQTPIESEFVKKIEFAVDSAETITNPVNIAGYLVKYDNINERVEAAAAKLYYGSANTISLDTISLSYFYLLKEDYFKLFMNSGALPEVIEGAINSSNYQLSPLEEKIAYLFAHNIDSLDIQSIRDMEVTFLSILSVSDEVSEEFKALMAKWIYDYGDFIIVQQKKPCGFWCWVFGLKGNCMRLPRPDGGNVLMQWFCNPTSKYEFNCKKDPDCYKRLGNPNGDSDPRTPGM